MNRAEEEAIQQAMQDATLREQAQADRERTQQVPAPLPSCSVEKTKGIFLCEQEQAISSLQNSRLLSSGTFTVIVLDTIVSISTTYTMRSVTVSSLFSSCVGL